MWISGQRVLVTWDEFPFAGVRAWFACPQCSTRVKHLYFGPLVCRRCAGLEYACDHQHTIVPGLRAAMKLRRRLGISPYPFSEIPKRPRHHVRYYRLVAALLVEEQALRAHLRGVNGDLQRRKARRKW